MTTPAVAEVGWLRDRTHLCRFRLRAAAYGVRMGWLRQLSEFGGLVVVVVSIGGLALAVHMGSIARLVDWLGEQSWATWLALAGGCILLVWAAIRRLGNLSWIMRTAAASTGGASAIRRHMAEGMKSPTIYGQLRRLYGDAVRAANAELAAKGLPGAFEFVDLPGDSCAHEYGAVVLTLEPTTSAPQMHATSMEPASRGLEYSRFAESRQRLMRAWRSQGDRFREQQGDETGGNYVLRGLGCLDTPNGTALSLDVAVAAYGQIVRTCDALINELALFAFLNRSGVLRTRTFLRCLPWRRREFERSEEEADLFLRPLDRAAGLGVALVTILQEERDDTDPYVAALGTRSNDVGTYPACLHVIPAGMLNTRGSEPGPGQSSGHEVPDWFVTTTMKSEFFEEWYDDLALERGQLVDWRGYVDQRWQLELDERPIVFTGVAFDLLNMRPEICGYVLIERFGGKLSWEYLSGQAHQQYDLAKVGDIPPTDIVQSGAAALRLAQQAMFRGTG
ncbi:MAG: hypothetical protein QOD07_2692 [Frankiaceae bacterium]|nr:hypothetical protein [Frankiaceae bacterium]